MVGVVIGDAVSNDVVSDVERGGDGGGASHIGDNRLAGEEAGDGEARGTKRKAGLSSLFVKFGAVDAESGRASGAVGQGVGVADKAREVGEVGVVFVEDDDVWVHLEKGGFGSGVFLWRHSVERGREKIGHGCDVNGEAVEDVVFKRLGRGGNDDVGRAGFPGFGEEFVEDGGLDRGVGSEDSDVLAGGAKNLVNEVCNNAFAGGAGNANELHIADGVAIITRQKLSMGALEFRLKGRFLFRFGFIRGGLRVIHHEVIITQKTLQGRVFYILLFSRLYIVFICYVNTIGHQTFHYQTFTGVYRRL